VRTRSFPEKNSPPKSRPHHTSVSRTSG